MAGILPTDHKGLAIAGAFALVYVAIKAFGLVHAVLFHPLHKIPGPWWAAASRVPYARALLNGTTVEYLTALHKRYGPVVRYSPNEISVTNGEQAWQEVYGFRIGKQRGVGTFEKDRVWYAPGVDGIPSVITAHEDAHARQRRTLSHAFSEKSLRSQEWLVQRYANLLVSKIKETNAAEGRPANMEEWFTWTTFDVIADLTFGKPFGCLENLETHRYVLLMLGGFKSFGIFYCLHYFPLLGKLRNLFMDTSLLAKRAEWLNFVKTSTLARIDSKTDRHDFMTDILTKKRDEEEKGNESITVGEMVSTSSVLMAAGTDTTATTLTGATYLMLRHPEVYRKVVEEVRSRFNSQDEITIDAANQLTYMIAVLTETLRIMPPVPAGFTRKVPKTGGEVSGYWIDGSADASVSVTHHTSYHDPINFRDADKFVPERWLGDEKYKDDNRATFQPFSFGPRNCLGRNLAYAEMRVFLAKIVFNFDMELAAESQDWMDKCDVFTLWIKAPLLVHMTAVS